MKSEAVSSKLAMVFDYGSDVYTQQFRPLDLASYKALLAAFRIAVSAQLSFLANSTVATPKLTVITDETGTALDALRIQRVARLTLRQPLYLLTAVPYTTLLTTQHFL